MKRPCPNNQHSIKDNNPHSIQSKSVGVFILCILFVLFSGSLKISFAQNIEIPSSFNPVGSGARAMGMGGAFIGVADDATAASWNPGGLIQLRLPEISFVIDTLHRTEDISFGGHPEAEGDQTVSLDDINYLSIVYPFTWLGRNMVLSVNYQNLYNFEREWKFPHIYAFTDYYSEEYFYSYQQGYLSALGIAYCIQITPQFSFGLTLNLWEDDLTPNEWESRTIGSAYITESDQRFISGFNLFDRYSFDGYNMNLGLLWNANNKLTIGAVFKSPFDADLENEHTFYSYYIEYSDSSKYSVGPYTVKESQKLSIPMSYGLGFAYRFSDEFTASLDIYRTEWDDFVLSTSGGKQNPITGLLAENSKADPTWQVRMGSEYIFTIFNKYPAPFRVGIFYDPVPCEGSPEDYFGFSLGSGIVIKQFIFDIAYQYRFGTFSLPLQDLDFSWDAEEHMLYLSMIYHFKK